MDRRSVLGLSVAALVMFSVLGSLVACNPRRSSVLDPRPTDPTGTGEDGTEGAGRSSASKMPASGTSCAGRDDCPSDQVCVEQRCRYRETSVAGEILATSAQAQVDAGEWEGAARTYDQAIAAFEAAHAPVPPEVLCASASLMLRTATDPAGREGGAQRADRCFRASVPGSAAREDVRRAVARLRFEGLDPALCDRPQPPDRFFTLEQSRPTVDALAIDVQFPESEEPGAAQVRAQITGDVAHRAIAECFVQDWDVHHQRTATASLVVRYSTRLRDMGTYDAFDPELVVDKTTVAEDGFEPCVARALTSALTAPRGSRVVAWQQPMEVSARVQ